MPLTLSSPSPGSARFAHVAVAIAMIAALSVAPQSLAWLQQLYPLPGGALRAGLWYVMASLGLWGVGLVALGAWVAPWWTLAHWLAPADTLAVRGMRALVIAMLAQPLVHAVVLQLAGPDAPADRYRLMALSCQGVLLVVSALAPGPAGGARTDTARGRLLLGFSFVLTLAIAWRVLWSDLVSDGLEMLTMGRSLSSLYVPRLWSGALPDTDLVMFTAAYPVDWLIASTGFTEVAARLPVAGYMVAVGLGILAIAEHRGRRLSSTEVALLLAGCATACLTIAFNTSYDPYWIDLASPAGVDLLAVALLCATLYFILAAEFAWVAAGAVLFALTRPTGPILFGLLIAAVLLVERSWRHPALRGAVLALMISMAVATAHLWVVQIEHGGLLNRIRYLRFDDWERVRFLVIPNGILPALALVLWRRLDAVGRTLTVVTVAYFAFFYSMAFVSLHHFAPAMLLPLAICWRREAAPPTGRQWLVVAGLAVAAIAALPDDFRVYRESRRIGATLAFDTDQYFAGWQGIIRSFNDAAILDTLFAQTYTREPQRTRVADRSVLMHYGVTAGATSEDALYIVRRNDQPAPENARRVASRNGVTLFVRDTMAWRRQQADVPAPAPFSPVYRIPRTTLQRYLGIPAGEYQIDLSRLAGRQ